MTEHARLSNSWEVGREGAQFLLIVPRSQVIAWIRYFESKPRKPPRVRKKAQP